MKLSSAVLAALAAVSLFSCNPSSSVTTDEGNWVKVSSFYGVSRYYAVSFVIGNYGYVATGRDKNNNPLGDMWRYDPNTDSWFQLASLPNGKTLYCGVGFSIGGEGYAGSGTNGMADPATSYYRDFYQYDTATNTWTQIADFPGGARYRATAFAIGTTGYVTCGMDSAGNYLKDMWAYNQVTGSWTQSIGSPGDKRVGAAAFVYNGLGYLIGGTNDAGAASTGFYAFNPSSNNWITLRQITNATDSSFDDSYTDISRTDGVAFVAPDPYYTTAAFITTGKTTDGTGSLDNVTWAYDFAHDVWETRTSYERSSRYGAVAFSLNGYGYIGTGTSGGGGLPYSNFDIFYPNEAYNAND